MGLRSFPAAGEERDHPQRDADRDRYREDRQGAHPERGAHGRQFGIGLGRGAVPAPDRADHEGHHHEQRERERHEVAAVGRRIGELGGPPMSQSGARLPSPISATSTTASAASGRRRDGVRAPSPPSRCSSALVSAIVTAFSPPGAPAVAPGFCEPVVPCHSPGLVARPSLRP